MCNTEPWAGNTVRESSLLVQGLVELGSWRVKACSSPGRTELPWHIANKTSIRCRQMEEAAVRVPCGVSWEMHMQRKATTPLACPQPCSADTQGRAEPVSQGSSLCHRRWTGSHMVEWNIFRTEAMRLPGVVVSGSVCWTGWRVCLATYMRKKLLLETKAVFSWSRLSCVLDRWPLIWELLIKLRRVGNCSQSWAHCFLITPLLDHLWYNGMQFNNTGF